MTTPPAPSASEQTHPLVAHVMRWVEEREEQSRVRSRAEIKATNERCEQMHREHMAKMDALLARLESAARPAPGISEITSDDLDRAPPSGPAFERFWVGFEGSTFSPQGAAAAAFYAGWRAAVAYASVRERERAATAWPDWMTGYKAKMADEAAQLERERAGKVQDETPTGASTSCPESCECDKVCKLSKPTVAPPAAAPGDEAAREAQAIVDLEWVCLYYEKVSRAPGEEWPKDKWDNAAYEMVSMVRKALAGFRSLSRFPRPADNAMPEPERRVQAMAVAGRIFNKFVCPGTTPDTCTRAIVDALLEFPRPADTRERGDHNVTATRIVEEGFRRQDWGTERFRRSIADALEQASLGRADP